MLQVQAASCTSIQLHALLAFLPLLVTWNWEPWSSCNSPLEIWDTNGSKYGLHLWAHSLITTCRWPLGCNRGDHSLVKLTFSFHGDSVVLCTDTQS